MSDMKTAIARLQDKNLPHADASVFGDLPEGTVYEWGENVTPQTVAERFLPKQAGCPNCGCEVINWGLQHGVAVCVDCGWLTMVYHYFKVPGEEQERRVVQPLWYHPDELVAL